MYKSICTHPDNLDETTRDMFDDVDLIINAKDYYAVCIIDNCLYICSREIKLERTLMMDFIQIAKNSLKNISTYTEELQKQRRNFRTKDSKRSANSIYKNISLINKRVSSLLKNKSKIIINDNYGYRLNVIKKVETAIYIQE